MNRSPRMTLATGLPPARTRVRTGHARANTPGQAGPARRAPLDGDLPLLMRSPQDAATAGRAAQPIHLHRPADEHGVLPLWLEPGRSH